MRNKTTNSVKKIKLGLFILVATVIFSSPQAVLGWSREFNMPDMYQSMLRKVNVKRFYKKPQQFSDSFQKQNVVEEAGSMTNSQDPDWWLNSGGRMIADNGVGMTLQGELEENDKWRLLYAQNNPLDTDDGYHPQNIFRLVTRSQWQDLIQQAYFKIINNNLSASPNRNASNGLLLMNRYIDGNNLYYAGLRVDGAVVVKKKQAGVYTTLGYQKIFPGTYDRELNPNLLPKDTWLGIKTELNTDWLGQVQINVYLDQGQTGAWQQVLSVTDTDSPILDKGYAGIRTDFMDVEFDDYLVVEDK